MEPNEIVALLIGGGLLTLLSSAYATWAQLKKNRVDIQQRESARQGEETAKLAELKRQVSQDIWTRAHEDIARLTTELKEVRSELESERERRYELERAYAQVDDERREFKAEVIELRGEVETLKQDLIREREMRRALEKRVGDTGPLRAANG
jgi:chromosome segregation ATPase